MKVGRTRRRAVLPLIALGALVVAAAADDRAAPPGPVIDPPTGVFPVQHLRSELAGGRQSALVALGNTAFSSPLLFGAAARAAGLSCNACHTNGHVNRAFFVPGASARPGGLDPTGPLFHPPADNGVADHVDIPSLRGVRFLGPYGRDGRIGSLREFAHQVITVEFGGPEPDPLILDALTAYMSELEFIPNSRLTPLGDLAPGADDAARRGEAAFRAPRAGLGGRACASCHVADAAFTDGRIHDVGTGGRFRTPTLLDANASAPYLHDGRFADYAAVLDGYDRRFALGLGAAEKADLVAYLTAIGDQDEPDGESGFRAEMSELAVWIGAIDAMLARGRVDLVRFIVDTTILDQRRIARLWPDGAPPTHQNQRPDRRRAPVDYPALEAGLRRVAELAESGRAADARAALETYFDLADSMVANYPRGALGAAPRR